MRFSILLLLLVSLGTSGCAYRYQFDTGLPPSGQRVEEWRHIYMFGWIPAEPVDLEAACPNGASRFGSQVGVLNWLSALATFGLYSPRTIFVECASTGSAKLEVAR